MSAVIMGLFQNQTEGVLSFMRRLQKKQSAGGSRAAQLVFTLLMLAGAALLLWRLAATQMLLPLHLAALVLIGLLAALVTFLLTRTPARRVRFVLGVLWTIIWLALYAVGGWYVTQGQNALLNISQTETEVSNVSIYVLEGDPAQTLEDAADYIFGIMTELDRENTDAALASAGEQLGSTLTMAEYAGPTQLVDGLLDGSCGAIVLNQAYLDLFDELEGYEDIPDRLRALSTEQVETIVESQPEAGETEALSAGEVLTVYISGSDSRDSAISARARSDVNILASINPSTRQVLLISTPRDYYVPLSISGGVPDKLTHAGIYGVQVSMDTLAMLYGVDVNYFFRVNFTGFVDIIDALGGVDVYSEYTFDAGNYHFDEGYNIVDGAAALAFCRERHAFASGDRQRGRNQMALIQAVIRKAASPAILSGYSQVLESAAGCMETNISYDTIAALVRDQLENGGDWNVVTYSVDGIGDSQVPYSLSSRAYVMIPDTDTVDTAKELLAQVANGERLIQP